MAELVGIIFALSMNVLVGDIIAQQLKAISRTMTAWPSSYGFVTARELHCFATLMHLRVSAPIF